MSRLSCGQNTLESNIMVRYYITFSTVWSNFKYYDVTYSVLTSQVLTV